MADYNLSDPVSVALDHFMDALRDLCTALAETEAATWVVPRGARSEADDDQLNELASLL